MSSTYSCTSAKGASPGRPTAIPSAMVAIDSSRIGWPAASEGGYAAADSACTPTTRTDGSTDLTASATPASRPPPPVHTTTVRTSGILAMISRPTVPWPAMTSGWSNGWMSTAPVSCENSCAASSAWSMDVPWKRTSAP